jgi:hypothetical protein
MILSLSLTLVSDLVTVWSTGGLTWSDVKLANRSLRLLHRAGRTLQVDMQILLSPQIANPQIPSRKIHEMPCLGFVSALYIGQPCSQSNLQSLSLST